MFAKKSIVAGAALLALATAAQAQVKVYGYLDIGFGSYEGFSEVADGVFATERTTRVESGNMMTSFIGFSGSEDLGGGLKAEFVLESFVGVDNGGNLTNLANGFWSRGSWVGLSGDFGRIALGQYDNAFFVMGLTYNPFGSSMVFSPTMVSYYSFGGFGADGAASLGYDTGWVNSITYETPNFGGFTAALQYSPKETSSDAEDVKDNYAISAAYNAGPLSVMGVYTSSGANNSAYFIRQKNWGFGASYDFGAAKIMGQYSNIQSEEGGQDVDEAKFFQLGATIPLSASGNVLISYGQTKYEPEGGGSSAKLKQWSLGYDHSISKRTGAYIAFSNQKLSGVETVDDDDSANIFAIGVRHSF